MGSLAEPPTFSDTSFGRAARRLFGRILRERSSPARLGWAVALGVLIGASPFYGFHLALCLIAATILGLNRAVTYLAANISLPWIAPFLIFGSVELGSFLLVGRWLPVTWDSFREIDPWTFAQEWLIGSFALGVLLGAPAGLLTFTVARLYRRHHPLPRDVVSEAAARAAARFRDQGRFVFGYVQGKLEHDPVYRYLAGRCPLPGPILDLGCGRGQTVILLAELQPSLRGTGIDWDEAKLARARRAAAGLEGLSFRQGDIRNGPFPSAKTLLLVDVLHYQPAQAQDETLRQAARALQPGGVLYVREIDAAAGWRARFSCWQERIGRRIGFNRGPTLCFRPASELLEVLAAEGLVTTIASASAGLPLSNVIIEARHHDSAGGRQENPMGRRAPGS